MLTMIALLGRFPLSSAPAAFCAPPVRPQRCHVRLLQPAESVLSRNPLFRCMSFRQARKASRCRLEGASWRHSERCYEARHSPQGTKLFAAPAITIQPTAASSKPADPQWDSAARSGEQASASSQSSAEALIPACDALFQVRGTTLRCRAPQLAGCKSYLRNKGFSCRN